MLDNCCLCNYSRWVGVSYNQGIGEALVFRIDSCPLNYVILLYHLRWFDRVLQMHTKRLTHRFLIVIVERYTIVE